MDISFPDSSVRKFIKSLDEGTISKIARTIDLLERFGNRLKFPHSKKITKDIFELRVSGRQEIRLLYIFRDNQATIVHGFIKKTQKSPRTELVVAIKKIKLLQS